jgi:ring-1,2-phenylacetyl-CoA epoxidase subunit PaaD
VVTPVVSARDVASDTADPELPQLTIGDLGILRDVRQDGGRVLVTITPTYSGCPALREIRADLTARLQAAGFGDVEIVTALTPPWTSDWVTVAGRAKLAAAGIAPPTPRGAAGAGVAATPLLLTVTGPAVRCPRCGSPSTVRTAAFSGTACKALHRCTACREPFESVKTI